MMRIAVISDTRLPTAWQYPGHGLGKSMLLLAEGLAERGHEVMLFAGPQSAASVPVTVCEHETQLARRAFMWGPDVVLDGSHSKQYQRLFPGEPVVNRSADRESAPGRHAVYPSQAHALYHNEPHGMVIYSAADERVFVRDPEPLRDYLLWLGPVDVPHKRVDAAIRAAQMAAVPLIIAGTGRIQHEGFIGAVQGKMKVTLMQHALAVLVTGEIEAGPLTCLEAALCGTPVIGLEAGGTPEYIGRGQSGYVCKDERDMANAIRCVQRGDLAAAGCRAWVLEHRGRERMLAQYERLLIRVMTRRREAA